MAKKKKSDEDQIKGENVNESDDNFGLPEIAYEPLNRDEVPVEEKIVFEETKTETRYTETTSETTDTPVEDENTDVTPEEEEIEAQEREIYHNSYSAKKDTEQSLVPRVVGIIFVLALAGLAGWYFLLYQPQQKAEQEKARMEALRKQEADKLKESERLAELKRQEDEQRRADSLANAKPAIGTIETLDGRTGRYYVVVASAIDDDLIMDYAKELSKKGVSTKIIPPFGKTKFSRIAVSEGDTYADAQTIADGMKADYGDGAWVVKY